MNLEQYIAIVSKINDRKKHMIDAPKYVFDKWKREVVGMIEKFLSEKKST